ncbi:MAG: hypothetical protein RL757_2986 [Bacteroidota bacterium]
MKKIFFAFFLLSSLFIAPPPVFGQKKGKKNAAPPLNGHWSGVVTQDFRDPKTGATQRVDYEMYLELRQNGEKISGTGTFVYRDKATGKAYQAVREISGVFKENRLLKYEEGAIIRSDSVPQSEWCQKKAELIYRKTSESATLEGMWEGFTASFGACTPGRILLKKRPSRV